MLEAGEDDTETQSVGAKLLLLWKLIFRAGLRCFTNIKGFCLGIFFYPGKKVF